MEKLQLIGSIGQDATINQVKENSVINFSICVNNRVFKDGNWTDAPKWFRASIWRKTESNEKILPYLKKGVKVFVEGQVTASQYKESTQLEINVNNLELLSK